ncbi:probable LRR receptor-like serine/threonine-protein kinase At1g53430 [Lathyrus oleraceus]|uniref:probable LRR receptor-like serine/threonine-protein kinase At1g53430 n=1 Tax=Pisum sativum TaxID=3888 RepID=UPI0021CEDB8A|nr:probable LRR receptor-like serine/threonine-protein kinase At1g53430 [Pisum sativum]
MISALQHPNLVKLYGYCIKGNQLLLVYEYMENNSLARALFGKPEQKLNLDWRTRMKICVGIARGLTYLHEESRLKIVHRDIKATNVLLDKHLNAKISDFGLAKLDEEENTHISTRIAGTIGYMAPEYEMRGYLTDKADVYSFGVVALEIVSGMSNTNYRPKEEFVYLLDWAYVLQEQGNLLELVDPSLGSNYSAEEAMRMLQLALLCTNPSPTLRAPMSSVVSMLEGNTPIQAPIIKRSDSASGARFKAFELLSLFAVKFGEQPLDRTKKAVKIPAKKAAVEASPSTAKKPSTKVSRKPPTIQKKKNEEEKEEDKVPNEESGDESPELIPPPQKKKKLTKVSSQRSIVNPIRKDSASTPPAKPQSTDTGRGESGFNTEIPEEQVVVERTPEKILEEIAPEEDVSTSDHDMQTVGEFDTTVGEASEDESPPHPGLHVAPQGDDIEMEVVVEDTPEDGAARDGDNQSKRTEVEHTSTRNTPPAPDRVQGSSKSTGFFSE